MVQIHCGLYPFSYGCQAQISERLEGAEGEWGSKCWECFGRKGEILVGVFWWRYKPVKLLERGIAGTLSV